MGYPNDSAERTMIHWIIACVFEGGGKTEANYRKAYDFIESDWGGIVWERYYDCFKQLDPDSNLPRTSFRKAFLTDARTYYKKFVNKATFKPVSSQPIKPHQAKMKKAH